jgi:hypothetical protein
VYNKVDQCYQAIGGVDDRRVIKLSPVEQKDLSFFAFVSSLLQSILTQGELKQTLQPESTAIFDFTAFIKLLETNKDTYK